MKRAIQSMRCARAWFSIYRLEIDLQGQNDAIAECTDPDLHVIISVARRITQRELVTARQRYHDLLPPGERRTWRLA